MPRQHALLSQQAYSSIRPNKPKDTRKLARKAYRGDQIQPENEGLKAISQAS
jgi:hypothetical protein